MFAYLSSSVLYLESKHWENTKYPDQLMDWYSCMTTLLSSKSSSIFTVYLSAQSLLCNCLQQISPYYSHFHTHMVLKGTKNEKLSFEPTLHSQPIWYRWFRLFFWVALRESQETMKSHRVMYILPLPSDLPAIAKLQLVEWSNPPHQLTHRHKPSWVLRSWLIH